MFEKHLWKSDILSKDTGQRCRSMTCIFTYNVTLPQVFFKHFDSKNQLPGLSIIGTLVENRLVLNELERINQLLSVSNHQKAIGVLVILWGIEVN